MSTPGVKISNVKTTFGSSDREFAKLIHESPAPNQYRVAKFTEAAHSYSFPEAPK